MTLNRRQAALLRSIAAKGSVGSGELQRRFSVSRETVRKDLVALEGLGLISRGYGTVSYIDSERNGAVLRASVRLTKAERQDRIRSILETYKDLRISSLAAKLDVSTITVRSDVDAMERDGLVIRKHGRVGLPHSTVRDERRIDDDANPSKIQVLGDHSLLHINPGDTIFLDGEPVSRYIASAIPLYSDIKVTTNSVEIARILADRDYTSAIRLVPGVLSPNNGRIAMDNPEAFFASARIDKAFFSVAAYSNRTFFAPSAEDAVTALAVCAKAERIYLAIDSERLELRGKDLFPYDRWLPKIQEVLVDDGLSLERAELLFSKRDPVVIYGKDFVFQNLKRRKYRIGFLVNRNRNYFIQAVYNSLQESVAATKNVSLIIRESAGDHLSTVQNLGLLLKENVDLMIDFSLCVDTTLYIGEKCRSAGIKLIGIDLMIPGAVYFGADNALAGSMAGEKASDYIAHHWGGRLNRILVLGTYGIDPVVNLRIMSAIERVRAKSQVVEERIDILEWGNPAQNPTRELISLLKAVPREESVLIFAFNLRQLLVAHDIIARYRDPDRTIIVGQNFTQEVEELMRTQASPILGCVHYNPVEYGKRIMRIALDMLANKPVETLNYTTHSWVPNPSKPERGETSSADPLRDRA